MARSSGPRVLRAGYVSSVHATLNDFRALSLGLLLVHGKLRRGPKYMRGVRGPEGRANCVARPVRAGLGHEPGWPAHARATRGVAPVMWHVPSFHPPYTGGALIFGAILRTTGAPMIVRSRRTSLSEAPKHPLGNEAEPIGSRECPWSGGPRQLCSPASQGRATRRTRIQPGARPQAAPASSINPTPA